MKFDIYLFNQTLSEYVCMQTVDINVAFAKMKFYRRVGRKARAVMVTCKKAPLQ